MSNATAGKYLLSKLAAKGLLKEEGGVRYAIETITGETTSGVRSRTTLALWTGKGSATAEYRYVADETAALEIVTKYIASAAATARAKTERRAAAKVAKVAAAKSVTVGTIFYNSWGYEQTNIDYYEVVRVSPTGGTVWVRKIASKTVETTGYCSARVAPCPGEFVENAPELKKPLTQYGLSFRHGSASVVKPGETHYSSWGY